MNDKVSITTPKGGASAIHYVIAFKDNIIGAVTFPCIESYNLFKYNFEKLRSYGFSTIEMLIDVKEEKK